jgi:hypothetical protein
VGPTASLNAMRSLVPLQRIKPRPSGEQLVAISTELNQSIPFLYLLSNDLIILNTYSSI